MESNAADTAARKQNTQKPRALLGGGCAPRLDSPALFAALLGGAADGHFTIRPTDGTGPREQCYRDDALVLETRFDDFTVTDFLDCSLGRPRRRAGRCDLVRLVDGHGRFTVEFAPRLEFGRVPTRISQRDGGLQIDGTPDPIVLRSPGVEWTIRDEGVHHTAIADVELTGSTQVFELRHGTGSLRDPGTSAVDRCRLTERFWSAWAARLSIPGVASDLVRGSAIILKLRGLPLATQAARPDYPPATYSTELPLASIGRDALDLPFI